MCGFRYLFLRPVGLGLVIGLVLGSFLSFGQARVEEERLIFKTYPFFDPDPVPLIGPIYPYFKFHGYSLEGKDQAWRMVRLTNPYIEVLVAPEIGGKVWGAVEKSTGRAFIYWNKVIKFREIALRGPWTSGGIEFNFGIIGHAPTTATPVDYLILEEEDGSASCVVGATDLPSRTLWRVRIRLPAQAAYLETECFWFNPTPLHDSYYHWMTAAVDVGEDLKYYYPGHHFIGHDGLPFPWPLTAEGRDVSFYRNNNFGGSKSYHILGEYGEFFGGYWEKADFGYGHWSLHEDKPGQKLWIWSLARDGEIWRDLLTDPGNRQYTEPQTGLLFNQAGSESSRTPFKHAFFAPHAVAHWKEIWFPVKGIGGMVTASPHAVLNVRSEATKIRLGLSPLQVIDDELRVRVSGETVFAEHLKLQPLETYLREVEVTGGNEEITVELGKGKLRWSSRAREENRLSRPLASPEDFDWTSAEGLFIAGEERARERNYDEAMAKYKACLAKEPNHLRSLARLAELNFRRGEYGVGLDYARRGLAIDAYDPAVNFIYGTINRRLDKLADAKDGYGRAARSLEFRSAAWTELAALNVLEGDLDRAREWACRALDYNRFNLRAREILAVIKRLEADLAGARKVLDEILRLDPLSHFARFERWLLEPGEAQREAFISSIHNELPHETYLELALFYEALGLGAEAVAVLRMAPAYPVIDFWLAYLLQSEAPAESTGYLERAEQASPHLVFPFRLETIPVLDWARSKRPHWKTNYYLGLVLWNLGRIDEARALWTGLGKTPDWSPFYQARAKLLAQEGGDFQAIRADLERAVDLERDNWRAWRDLVELYLRRGDFREAVRSAALIYRRFPENSSLAVDYARTLLYAGETEPSLKVLEKTTILPYEGGWEGRDLYRQANLFLAARELGRGNLRRARAWTEKARLWPEHLGAGRPYEPDERLENFLLAVVLERRGEEKQARACYRAVAADTKKFLSSWSSVHLLGALALKKLKLEAEALALFTEWRENRGAEDLVRRWAEAVFDGRLEEADGILMGMRSKKGAGGWDFGTSDRFLPLVLAILESLDEREGGHSADSVGLSRSEQAHSVGASGVEKNRELDWEKE